MTYDWEELEDGTWCAVVGDEISILLVFPALDRWTVQWTFGAHGRPDTSAQGFLTVDDAKRHAELVYDQIKNGGAR